MDSAFFFFLMREFSFGCTFILSNGREKIHISRFHINHSKTNTIFLLELQAVEVIVPVSLGE